MELSLITWNIGYCGMDKDMDFFYHGSTRVFIPKATCIKNLNEFDSLKNPLKTYFTSFAKNYDFFFVPVTPVTPMGKVLSGLTILSKYQPTSSVRYSFPGEYGFPKQLFMLDRCFLVNVIHFQTAKNY